MAPAAAAARATFVALPMPRVERCDAQLCTGDGLAEATGRGATGEDSNGCTTEVFATGRGVGRETGCCTGAAAAAFDFLSFERNRFHNNGSAEIASVVPRPLSNFPAPPPAHADTVAATMLGKERLTKAVGRA